MIEAFLPDAQMYVQLLRFFFVLVAGILFTRIVLMPAANKAATRRGGDKLSTHSFENVVGLAGLFMSFIVALQGAQLGNLVTVLGAITAALTVAVGFGMRDQISNVVAGFFIMTDNPFVKGDYITAGSHEGVVKNISLRHTVINGAASEKVVLPNAMLTTSPLSNLTKGRKTKVKSDFKIAVKKSGEFEEIAKEKALEDERTLEKPEPSTSVKGLEDEKAVIGLSYWVRESDNVKSVSSDVTRQVLDECVRKGIIAEEKEDKK